MLAVCEAAARSPEPERPDFCHDDGFPISAARLGHRETCRVPVPSMNSRITSVEGSGTMYAKIAAAEIGFIARR